jgi:hypothetical protein
MRIAGQKGFDLPFPIHQVLPAAHLVTMDVALDSIKVRPFGVDRVVVKPQDVADLLE